MSEGLPIKLGQTLIYDGMEFVVVEVTCPSRALSRGDWPTLDIRALRPDRKTATGTIGFQKAHAS